MRPRILAAACGAALLLAPRPAAAQNAPFGGPDAAGVAPAAPPQDPPASAAATPGSPADASVPVRPIFLVGLGGGGGLAVGADLGLRVAPVTARFAYRAVFSDGGYVTFASGRVGWIFVERTSIAVYAAAGVGKLVYDYNSDPTAGSAAVTAFSGELGVYLFPRWGGGPILAFALEALEPRPRGPDPRNGILSAPSVVFTVSVSPVAFLLARLGWH